MSFLHPLISMLIGVDAKLRRLITYWAATVALYALCTLLLWFEVWIGVIPVQPALWLTAFIVGGLALFYGIIRGSRHLGQSPSQLAIGQGYYAIFCIVAGYAIAGPVRGAALTILLVVLLFCGFALTPRKSRAMSAFTIVLLGLTMLWMTGSNPQRYPPHDEAVHFALAASTLVAVAFLTGQFNQLRQRLKAQKAELVDALMRIQLLATRDELTMLANRRHMNEVLSFEEKRNGKEGQSLCLALLDIDYFKHVNDNYGHAAGDQVLRSFAQQAKIALRATDVLARWGGEEFLLLLPDTEPQTAMAVLERIQVQMADLRLASVDPDLRVTFSAGLTTFSPGETVVEAVKRADKAMYQAKVAGRNTLRFFDPHMEAAALDRSILETELRHGLREKQFLLHYQPQVNSEGEVTGAEALVRWRHSDRGMVSPCEFIPLAEATGLIVPLGHWVLETACRQLVAWGRRPETAGLSVSVNVSARQFRHPRFLNQVLAVLDDTGVDPGKLKLELTESMLVDDMEDTIAKMNSLKTRGVSFSLDDFGTGYSSLSYLKRLPLKQLKIDQSFVRDVLTDSNDAVIARSIVTLAHSLGLSVIAEGVETESQKDFLARNGCRDFQGNLFSRPLSLDEFESFIGKSAAAAVASTSARKALAEQTR